MNEKHESWARMFRSGMTQNEIALASGVSRQAVAKVLKSLGVSRFEGGKSERSRTLIAMKKPISDRHSCWIRDFEAGEQMVDIAFRSGVSCAAVEKVISKYGASFDLHRSASFGIRNEVDMADFCSYEEAREALSRFFEQRSRARQRGIGWEFTFSEWWAVWKQSGKWSLRGRKIEEYVMARSRDAGPYAAWNVRIDTARNNLAESRFIRFSIPWGQQAG